MMKPGLDVFVDGSIFSIQSRGGISRIYQEIIPRMCLTEESLNIILVIARQAGLQIPGHPRMSRLEIPEIKSTMRPAVFWQFLAEQSRNLIVNHTANRLNRPLWHSTYYNTINKWRGASIVTVYDVIHERFPDLFNTKGNRIFREKKRKSIEAADAIISISETTWQDLEGLYNVKGKDHYVIPLAFSSAFRKIEAVDWKYRRNKPFLLYVGSRVHYKNFMTLMRAFSIWKPAKEFDILAVGAPLENEECRLLKELGILESVHVVSNVNDDDLCLLYNQAEAFVYPSLYEGFGMPLLEAMACGCPIVASNIPSSVEVARDCPYYFEPTNIESLIEALDFAIRTKKNSSRILSGYQYIKSYSWDETASQTVNVYRSLHSG